MRHLYFCYTFPTQLKNCTIIYRNCPYFSQDTFNVVYCSFVVCRKSTLKYMNENNICTIIIMIPSQSSLSGRIRVSKAIELLPLSLVLPKLGIIMHTFMTYANYIAKKEFFEN